MSGYEKSSAAFELNLKCPRRRTWTHRREVFLVDKIFVILERNASHCEALGHRQYVRSYGAYCMTNYKQNE